MGNYGYCAASIGAFKTRLDGSCGGLQAFAMTAQRFGVTMQSASNRKNTMAEPLAQTLLSAPDYLNWEPLQIEKHDFLCGEVFAMAGGTLQHNRATLRSMMALESHLAGSPCKVFSGDVKVAVNVTEHWFYPDVVVTCSAQDLSDMGAVAISEPVLVLEVLSPSTAAYDRGQKFISLQKLASLKEYALLDTQTARLEVFRRNAAARFELFVFEGVDCEAELASIGWRGLVGILMD